jgi:diketogulonate reductase-like aldo/keto reductase
MTFDPSQSWIWSSSRTETLQHHFLLAHNDDEGGGGDIFCITTSDFQSPPEEVTGAVDAALEVGYRHIDTAYMYQNEAAIGKTLKKWFDSGRLKREDIFIVTKVGNAEK